MLKWTLPLVLALPLVIAGCPKKKEEVPPAPAMEAPAPEQTAPAEAPPAEEAAPAEGQPTE